MERGRSWKEAISLFICDLGLFDEVPIFSYYIVFYDGII
jgi:hypothetical protein